jgi:hypothetical protein
MVIQTPAANILSFSLFNAVLIIFKQPIFKHLKFLWRHNVLSTKKRSVTYYNASKINLFKLNGFILI